MATLEHSANISLQDLNLSNWWEAFRQTESKPQAMADAAIMLAALLQQRAAKLQTPQERRQQAELDRMLQHPQDKATLTQMTDQAFRSESADRAVDQLVHILDVQGVPRFFSPLDRTLLKGFQSFGEYLPGVAVPMVKEKMRKETANVILPAEREMLTKHLQARRDEGVRMNVNYLGEALLGESEARRRLDLYLASLQMPEMECTSVKISTIYSQISPLARKHTLKVVGDRLELLYRAAARQKFTKKDGSVVTKFVYLDMEEYRDLHLTADVFMQTLDRPGMEQVRAGIALQGYVPDSHIVQQEITEWAMRRIESGKAPVTIRVVKGANMEMERVEASLRGWPQAPYRSKLETDANYKRMLHYGMQPQHAAAVRLGVASHNLFDVAYALLLAIDNHVFDFVQFEMLEGMANHQRRALLEMTQSLLLYAPACFKRDFLHAIGYLIRRLDENTGPENFLRYAFKITVNSPEWNQLAEGFCKSIESMDQVSYQPRRTQDRRESPPQPAAPENWQAFKNEPDTDFSLAHNGQWAESWSAQWKNRCDSNATEIPLAIGETLVTGGGALYQSADPSRPGVVVAKYQTASPEQLEIAARTAAADPAGWRSMSPESRYKILRQVAQEIRISRADLMGAAMADGGKTILESDPEVSEAVDFLEFYARCALDWQYRRDVSVKGLGVVVVISPWNFPIAIPCGGIAAALAAGNTVILKPASDTVLPAYVLCQCFWRAGVPMSALQFAPCSGRLLGQTLLGRPEIDAAILTGGTDTAVEILKSYPHLKLSAETGGKNATIVSGLSDRDLAIKNILHSAFSNAGQKCSATSLLLLEDEVFHDATFRDQLVDAVSSMQVGSAWDLKTKMGPLIRPPQGALLQGLKELEQGETWALRPTSLEDNPCLYSPGIKWNVSPGSFTHMTELFGPVLGVMPYRKLNEAIQIVNATGFGLTSGLESLDDREQEIWTNRIKAGNLYVNRSTTGAIVLRQPFGGMGKSAVGPGLKAGGPHYVIPFMQIGTPESTVSEGDLAVVLKTLPKSPALKTLWNEIQKGDTLELLRDENRLGVSGLIKWLSAIKSYDQSGVDEFTQSHDHFRLIGQDNFRRYLPIHGIRIRVAAADTWYDILCRIAAGAAAGVRTVVSSASGVHRDCIQFVERMTRPWAGDIEFIEESDDQLANSIRLLQAERIRYAHHDRVSDSVRAAAVDANAYVADYPVSACGDAELIWYVREQSVCVDYHRYGNLGTRGGEPRSDVL